VNLKVEVTMLRELPCTADGAGMHHVQQKGHTVLWLGSLALQSGHRFRAV
jgi:hypothetical protein